MVLNDDFPRKIWKPNSHFQTINWIKRGGSAAAAAKDKRSIADVIILLDLGEVDTKKGLDS